MSAVRVMPVRRTETSIRSRILLLTRSDTTSVTQVRKALTQARRNLGNVVLRERHGQMHGTVVSRSRNAGERLTAGASINVVAEK